MLQYCSEGILKCVWHLESTRKPRFDCLLFWQETNCATDDAPDEMWMDALRTGDILTSDFSLRVNKVPKPERKKLAHAQYTPKAALIHSGTTDLGGTGFGASFESTVREKRRVLWFIFRFVGLFYMAFPATK